MPGSHWTRKRRVNEHCALLQSTGASAQLFTPIQSDFIHQDQ